MKYSYGYIFILAGSTIMVTLQIVKILTVPGPKMQIERKHTGFFSFVNFICFHQYPDLDYYCQVLRVM